MLASCIAGLRADLYALKLLSQRGAVTQNVVPSMVAQWVPRGITQLLTLRLNERNPALWTYEVR